MNNSNKKINITALIPAYNVEEKIAECIKSVDFVNEIIVIDGNKNGHSTDKTAEIAEKMGAKVIQHKYEYSSKQKNWAIPKAKYDWIILLDTDEVVTQELKQEIIDLYNTDEIENYDGFGIPRKHFFLNKWLRWGGRYPLRNIRLFRKTCRYEDRDVHAHIILPKNRVKDLKGDILHFSDPTLEHFFEKFNRYTTYQANYMIKFAQSRKEVRFKNFFTYNTYIKAVIKDYWYFMPLTPFLRFIYMYFVRLGFLDGRHGFLIATLYSFQDYVSKTKYLELKGKKPRYRFLIQDTIKNFIPESRSEKGIIDRLNKEELKTI